MSTCAWMADENRKRMLAGNKKRKAVLPDIQEKDRKIAKAVAKTAKDIKPGGSRKIKCPACGSVMLIIRSGYTRKLFAKCKKCDATLIE